MFTTGTMQTILLLAATLPLLHAAPAPSTTLQAPRDSTWTAPKITHSVVAGRPGLRFDPENIVAQVGDIVEFHFLPANHSVVEASFANPCQPKDADSFFSGFFPVAKNADGSVAQSKEVFQIEVKDDKPIWFYCAQPKGAHCQSGMVGVVNQKFDGPNTLEVFRRNAAKVVGDAGVQAEVQPAEGRKANPNPLGGF